MKVAKLAGKLQSRCQGEEDEELKVAPVLKLCKRQRMELYWGGR